MANDEGVWYIWTRALAATEWHLVPGTQEPEQIFWSPDESDAADGVNVCISADRLATIQRDVRWPAISRGVDPVATPNIQLDRELEGSPQARAVIPVLRRPLLGGA
jgi:hypothetical protein